MKREILGIIIIIILGWVMIVQWLLWARLRELSKSAKKIRYWIIWLNIFSNNHKEDKSFNNLLLQLRVALSLLFILGILSAIPI